MCIDTVKHSGSYYILASVDANVRDILIPKLVENVTKFGLDKFDAIVCRGMSGALVAPIIAYLIKKPVVLVRKDKDTHSAYWVEGLCEVNRYIIIDDLIASGATMREILTKMKQRHDDRFVSPHECVGIFLYCDNRTSNFVPSSESTISIPVSSFSIG